MSVIEGLLKGIRGTKSAAYGFLDSLENGSAKGWAFDPEDPSASLSIELSVDGQLLETVVANRYRSDLQEAGVGDGHHGFEFRLPKRVMDSKLHTLEARIAGARESLKNSPISKVFEAIPEEPPIAAKNRVVNESALGALSVVMLTYRRAAKLASDIRAAIAPAAGMDVEIIVVALSSDDETVERLRMLSREFPGLRWEAPPQATPAQGRNLAVSMASHELVLFLGEGTEPTASDFYRQHLNAHRMLPSARVAVLGKIVWPNAPDERVSFLMSHIQGAGGQQFGFYNLTPYTWLDWRFFNTANFSFKKSVVADWSAAGFHDDAGASGLRDTEFAYRVNNGLEGGWQVLYIPTAAVKHGEAYTVRQFIEQRMAAGISARRFTKLHPEAAQTLGTEKVDALLASPARPVAGFLEDLVRMVEGVKSWAVVVENRYNLGSQNWHGDLLSAVFELSYLQGYIMSLEDSSANYGAAYQYLLERFQEKMANAASFEVFGRFPSFPLT